ncbi:coniferyl aldehyde dehydrogenase [Ideonella sp. A 288]|uniref:coniferyl aldehyde dehydrogenase n=1 Tax=Ideonella sp. A 288 TaxID=1962181 RepID=UPI001F2B09F6|nr:coniferyl aldehyde dehydrogenase [Ideonella sp. A 288]
MNLVGQTRDRLHTPRYGTAPGQQVILYRIYVADKGTDETAGAGLPVPVLTMPDGKVLRGAETCTALRTRQPLQLDPAAMAVPMNKYHELLAAAARFSPVHPATNPPTWHQQLDRDALYGIYTGTPPKAGARRSEGGFYPNLDNQYIRAILNRKLGKVFVVRGKAPTTPRTVNGEPTMGSGDLRYWSFCSNQGFANTRVNQCAHDEHVPVGPDGFYTIVVSRAADRPRNAIPQCGIAWLPMADDGDGAVDADVTVLQLRHMLGGGSASSSTPCRTSGRWAMRRRTWGLTFRRAATSALRPSRSPCPASWRSVDHPGGACRDTGTGHPSGHAMDLTDLRLAGPLHAALAAQRQACLGAPVPGLRERTTDLRTLQRFIRENKAALCDAVSADYGHRSRHETLLAEIAPAIDGIDHAIGHLRGWMTPQRRSVDWRHFFGACNRVIPQPLGVVGVIVPWNLPVNLSLVPLSSIFAAGNRAMVKMSEHSRHLAALLIERMPGYFPPEKLRFFDESGGVGVEFSKLLFDHLLLTGSGRTGRAVMAAAARNLCPVTLELGGKSPAIVCEGFPLKVAAERILFVKCLNAGQICTTVDHAWLPHGRIDEFVQLAREIVARRYPRLDSPDYTSIIDRSAFDRLVAALEEARSRGATLVPLLPGPAWDADTRKIAPHVVLHAPEDCALMQQEIFGPILPLRGYARLDEVAASINAGPRPLALYPFSHDRHTVQMLLDRVMSGGVSVNDALFHVGQHDLPFGGVGASGMGHYHGREGFETFSKMRPVFYQARFSPLQVLWPPYRRLADRVLAHLTR